MKTAYMPSKKQQKNSFFHVRYLAYAFSVGLILVGLFLIINDLLHYLLVMKYELLSGWPYYYPIAIWLLLVVVTVIISKSLPKSAVSAIGLMCIILSIFVHSEYLKWHRFIVTIPKIESINKTRSIQGDRIVIKGKNFGHQHDKGTVKVDDLEMNITDWSDRKVVVVQPVPHKYFTGTLILENAHGNTAEVYPYAILDPAEVL